MNRVLIVDDYEMILNAISMMVKRLKFEPLVAKSALEALDKFKKDHIGIAIIDLNLGNDMDGIALCSRMLYLDNAIVTIATSGFFSEYDKAYCLSAGFSDFLQKPIRIDELNSALTCAFERRSRWMRLP